MSPPTLADLAAGAATNLWGVDGVSNVDGPGPEMGRGAAPSLTWTTRALPPLLPPLIRWSEGWPFLPIPSRSPPTERPPDCTRQ